MNQVNKQADTDGGTLRLSMDAKATVKIGNYSRGGKNRVQVHAADHDFHSDQMLTPVGILLPAYDELFLYGVGSKVTSDCLVDILRQWWQENKVRFSEVRRLVLNLDNGPENNSRRTQFMFRLVSFAQQSGLRIDLAYYPPYHSKYNPVERCWGILEQHWNGSLLDSVDAVLQFAASMTWCGRHPFVSLVSQTYQNGVRLSSKAMNALESQLSRFPGLEKWFVTIRPSMMSSEEFNC